MRLQKDASIFENFLIVALVVIVVASVVVLFDQLHLFTILPSMNKIIGNVISVEPTSAEDIYPLFICPCCGQRLDPNNICCGAAKERIDHIDLLVSQGLSENDVIIKMVQKYGIDSLADESQKEKVKAELIKNAPKNKPIIHIEPEVYDFGDVSQAKGIASTILTIRNDGKADLIIDNLDTSCMCTSASVIYNGKEGPKFNMAMHGNPKGWSVTIPPGDEAQLKIYYDPNAHGKLRGPVTRTVKVFSNDPVGFEKKVRIELNQVA
jgi:hypothetical protein